MREWWKIEKDSRDQLSINSKSFFLIKYDNCLNSWDSTIIEYCVDCAKSKICHSQECENRKTYVSEKKYCLQCQDTQDYCGKPYPSLC